MLQDVPMPQTYDALEDDATDGAVFAAVHDGLNPLRAMQAGVSRLRAIANEWYGAPVQSVAGRMAEELHVATFNADAAAKHSPLRAATTASRGNLYAPADVTVVDASGRQLLEAQLKYNGNARSTTKNISSSKYDGMLRLVPADQVDRVRVLARGRGVYRAARRNYAATANGATDRLEVGGARSSPLSLGEALDAASNPTRAASRLLSKHLGKALKNGAIAGAAIGGGLSAISNCVALGRGTKSAASASFDTLKDTVNSSATGAAVGGIALAAETALMRVGAAGLANGAAPVALALTAVEVGKDTGRLLLGQIDGTEFTKSAGRSVAKGGLTWAGMEGGAALGTLVAPGVGTAVGAFVGGVAGALAGGWATRPKGPRE